MQIFSFMSPEMFQIKSKIQTERNVDSNKCVGERNANYVWKNQIERKIKNMVVVRMSEHDSNENRNAYIYI